MSYMLIRDLCNFQELHHIIKEKVLVNTKSHIFLPFFSNNFDSRGKGEERGDFGAAGGSKVNGSIPRERGKGKHSMSKKN
jgi:hypothetical protein